MDVKSMLVKLAEEQADKMKEEVMNHLSSDEMSDSIATAINKRLTYLLSLKKKNKYSLRK